MSRSDAQRAHLLENIADAILANGLGASNLRILARSAGISDRMLLYYFKDKAEVVGSALDILEMRLSAALDDFMSAEVIHFEPLLRDVLAVLDTDIFRPFMVLRVEIANLVIRGQEDYREWGERLAQLLLSWIKRQLNSSTAIARDHEAKHILIYIDGYFSQI